MKAVFLGGSRRISRLNSAIRSRLEELVSRDMRLLIGDANGADRAIQRQLAEWVYPNVVVFFVGTAPRNNEGHWSTHRIPVPPGTKGFEYYATKDRAMASEADCGLMLWDGESRGTLSNVENLVRDGKPVALYVSRLHRFISVRTTEDLFVTRGLLGDNKNAASPLQTALDLDVPSSAGQRAPRRRRTS
jgi:hypothetical protein